MASSNNQLGITVTARDEATKTLGGIHNALQSLDKGLTSISGRVSFGVFNELGREITDFVGSSLRAVVDVIPDLIHRGEEWASTVHQIALAGNVSAESASVLAAIFQDLTGSTENLDSLMATGQKNLTAHSRALQADGITATNVSDALEQLRQLYQKTGNSTQFASIAATLLGRSYRDALPYLSLNSDALQKLAQDAMASGRVMTEAQLEASLTWERTLNRLQGTITGTGAQLLAGISPVLSAVVDAFTHFIQAHLTEIVTFLSQVIVAAASFVGQLFGITDLATSFMSGISTSMNTTGDATTRKLAAIDKQIAALQGTTAGAKSGTDAYTQALQRQLDALNKSEARQRAQDQLQQTIRSLSQARADLVNVRSETIFASGMSEAQAILARQRHEADVKAAQDHVRSAQQAVADQQRQMALDAARNRIEAQIAAHQQSQVTATRGLTAELQHLEAERTKLLTPPKSKPTDNPIANLFGGMTQALADARTFGQSVAKTIQVALFGTSQVVDGGGLTIQVKQAGLFDKIGSLIDAIGNLITKLGGLVGPAATTASTLGDLFGTIFGDPGSTEKFKAEVLGPVELGLIAIGNSLRDALMNLAANIQTGLESILPDWARNLLGLPNANPTSSTSGTTNGATATLALYTPPGSSLPGSTSGTDLSSLFAQYMGPGSQSDQNAQDLSNWFGNSTDILSAVQSNTQVLPDGTLLTTLPDGTKVKTNVTDWNAGQLPATIKDWFASQGINTDVPGSLLSVRTPSGHTVTVDGGVGATVKNAWDGALGKYGDIHLLHNQAGTEIGILSQIRANTAYTAGGQRSSSVGGAGASASNPLHIRLSAPDLAKLVRGGHVSTTTRPATGY